MNPPSHNALEPLPASGADGSIDAVPIEVPQTAQKEFGGRKDGTDPTRFGDWEKGGRCIDF